MTTDLQVLKNNSNQRNTLILLRVLVLSLFYASTVYRVINIIAINFFLGMVTIVVLNLLLAITISSGKKVLIISLFCLLFILLISLITPVPLIPYFN
jgi:hypothetical protein